MRSDWEELPLEYPMRDALKIYAKRLVIFLAVVDINFAVFAVFLAFSVEDTWLKALFLTAFCVFISVLLFSMQHYLRRHVSDFNSRTLEKSDLVEIVAEAEMTKKQAEEAVDTVMAAIKESLKKGDTVHLVGFGTFTVKKRAERRTRVPKKAELEKVRLRERKKKNMDHWDEE